MRVCMPFVFYVCLHCGHVFGTTSNGTERPCPKCRKPCHGDWSSITGEVVKEPVQPRRDDRFFAETGEISLDVLEGDE